MWKMAVVLTMLAACNDLYSVVAWDEVHASVPDGAPPDVMLDAVPVDAAPPDAAPPDAAFCGLYVQQPPPCVSCCQKFVQDPGGPICSECRITVTLTGAYSVRSGDCDDQPCCDGVYAGLCP